MPIIYSFIPHAFQLVPIMHGTLCYGLPGAEQTSYTLTQFNSFINIFHTYIYSIKKSAKIKVSCGVSHEQKSSASTIILP